MGCDYCLITENSRDAICIVQDGVFKYFNPVIVQMVGYAADEIPGKSFAEFIHPEDRVFVVENNRRRLAGEELPHVYPFRVLRKDGVTLWVEINAAVIEWEGKPATLNFLRDITERKRIEGETAVSYERFRILARATNDTIWDWNLLSNELWWNDGITSIYGYRLEELEPTIESWRRRIHPDDKDRTVNGIHAVIDGSERYWSAEYRFRKADASYAYVFDRGYVIRDPLGKAVRMVGAMLDITERKQVETELKKKIDQLSKQNEVMLGREERVIEMKKEVNGLLRELGRSPKYNV